MPAGRPRLDAKDRRLCRFRLKLSDFENDFLKAQLPGTHDRERAPHVRALIMGEKPLALPHPDYQKHVRDNRPHTIEIPLTAAENAHLMKRVRGSVLATRAPYARSLIMGIEPRQRDTSGDDRAELIRVLANIGGNLNQIARDVNTGRTVEPSGFQAAIDELRDVLRQVALKK